MGVKTAGVGHFQIPTAPSAGTSCTSGAANAYTGSAVQLIASTAAALYITGIHVEAAGVSAATYKSVQLMIGAGGAETVLGQYLVPLDTQSTVVRGFRPIFPPIPVASGQRISVKTADSVGAQAMLVSIECIAQANVVDDGIAVGTVNLVNTLTTYTGNTPQTGDAFLIVKSGGTGDNAAIKAKTDSLPAAPASTTNITAGTITTVTNLTNAPTAGDLTAAMKASVTAAVPTAAAIRAEIDSNSTKLDATVSSRLATSGYTAPPSAATIAAAVWDYLVASATTVNSLGKRVVDYLTGDIFARLGAPAGASTAADIAAVKADSAAIKLKTDNLPASPAATGSIPSAAAIRTEIDSNSTKLDVAVSTRLASASYTAPPSAAAVRAEIDSNSTKLDATVSSRLATSGYTAPDNAGVTAIKAKTDNLPVSPAATGDIPTAAAIRAEIDSSSTKLDAAVSTRLASAGYTAPDNAGIAVAAVAAANLDVPVSTRLAADDYVGPENDDVLAIRAKTDLLTFTVANELDVNVQSINDTPLTGEGTTDTPWGPVP